MDIALNQTLILVYHALFEKIRVKIVKSIVDGDIVFNDIKDQLMTEFEKLHSKLNVILDEPLGACLIHFRSAQVLLRDPNRQTEAKFYFQKSYDKAVEGFLKSSTYEKKVLSVKYRILTALHLLGYFEDKNRNFTTIDNFLHEIWKDFLGLTEVKTSLEAEFGNKSIISYLAGSKSSKTRDAVLKDIASIRRTLCIIMKKTYPVSYKEQIRYSLKKVNDVVNGHDKCVTTLLMADNRLFSASRDKTIKVWDLASLTLIATLNDHRESVSSLAVSNNKLFSGSWDTTIKVWDLSSLKVISTLTGHTNNVTTLAVSDNLLYSGSLDKSINIWDINSLSLLSNISMTNYVFSLIVCNNYIFSESWEGAIQVWDLSTQSMVKTLIGQDQEVTSIALSDNRLFTGSYDNTIKVWDATSLRLISTLTNHKSCVTTLKVSDNRLFSGSLRKILVWELTSLSLIFEIDFESDVRNFEFADNRLFCGCLDGSIHAIVI